MKHLQEVTQHVDALEETYLSEEGNYAQVVNAFKGDPTFINFSSATNMHLDDIVFTRAFRAAYIELPTTLLTRYPPLVQQNYELEEALVTFLQKWFCLSLDPRQITTFNGVYGSYNTLLQLNNRQIILCPELLYQYQKACFTSAGKKVMNIPMDEEGKLDLFLLETILKKYAKNVCYVYINHNLGKASDSKYLKRLGQLLEKYDIYALYDADVILTSHYKKVDPLLPLKVIPFAQRALILINMSKEFGVPGLRIGFGIGPEALVSSIRKFQDLNLQILSPINKYLAKTLLETIDFTKTSTTLTRRMHTLHSHLKTLGWNLQKPEQGVNFFVPVPPSFLSLKRASPSAVFSYYIMKTCRIKLRPGDIHSKDLNGHIRFTISLPQQDIEEVFRRFKEKDISFSMPLPLGVEDDYLQCIHKQ